MLGERLHTAATGGITMEPETTKESRYYWKRIANALVDFFANMGGENPITFKCGDSVLTITGESIFRRPTAAPAICGRFHTGK
jgi:hypothetical protein